MTILLVLLLVLPLAGAVVAAVVPRAESAKLWALTVSAVTAVLAIGLAMQYDHTQAATPVSFELRTGIYNFQFLLGVDSISIFLLLLTVLLVPLAITASFDSVTTRPRQYYAWMLGLLFALIGVFVSRDLLSFYGFFELTLVPSFFLIGLWGGTERRYAAAKFFLYTFAASVFTLAAIVYLGAKAGSFGIDDVILYAQHQLSARAQLWITLGLLSAFVVKSALFPLHTWLPLAYTEAPTPGTVLLAGVLPKLGTYGILRLVIPIGMVSAIDRGGHSAIPTVVAIVGILAVIGIIYGAMIAWSQRDMKRVLAYSSFSHLGFCLLGLMAMNQIGLQGSILYMVNHGISTGALFLCAGMLFDRFNSRDQYDLSGLAKTMPRLAFFFVLFAMSSIGLPGLNGFVSEFLTLLGAFTSSNFLGPRFGAIAALGVILSAVYMLKMVGQIFYGPLQTPAPGATPPIAKRSDLNHREIAILVPLAVLVVFLGFYPAIILDRLSVPVDHILTPTVAYEPPPTPPSPATQPTTRPMVTAEAVARPDRLFRSGRKHCARPCRRRTMVNSA